MPRTAFFSREEIVEKALQIVREKGAEALSARTLSKSLNCSVSPIFTVFKNMDEVLECTKAAARHLFSDYVSDVTFYFPAFKEFGLRAVRFAREEENLFHYLFLSKDSAAQGVHPKALQCLEEICQRYGISKEQSEILHGQMWSFTCGLAILCEKEPENFPESRVGEMLSFQFMATMSLLKSRKKVDNITPQLNVKEWEASSGQGF